MALEKPRNIFLIGPMGAGKSSVGKHLAQRLHMDFYDTDEEIEKRTGVEIGWIFDIEGEHGFRARETAVIRELVQLPNIVLATGGGSILELENRELLKTNGIIVYLEVSLGYQEHRTMNESRRPLLRVKNRMEILEKLYRERTPLYQSMADFQVHTDERSIRDVADEIIESIKTKENKT